MSKQSAEFDLTQGNILQKLVLIALPIMGTQFLQMTYNLTDMFWLGRVGSDAVAASGTAGMYVWLSNAFIMIGRMGSEIGVSQSLGSKDKNRALHFSRTAMQIAGVLGIFYGLLLLVFHRPLVGFFGMKEANVAADAAKYLSIIGIGMPFTFLTGAITGSFNGSGNSRIPFITNACGLVVNMFLDPIFIFQLDMGIAGAAWATILAQAIVCLLGIWAIYRSPGRPFEAYRLFQRPNKEEISLIFQWTMPITTENLLFTLLTMFITRFTTAFGAKAIAVVRVGSQIESLSWLISGGFGTAVTAYTGQNYGAAKWGRIRQGFRFSSISMAVWGFAVTLTLIFGGQSMISLFLKEPDLIELGQTYLRILAACQIFACLEAVGSGAFRGIGKTAPPSIISVSCNTFRVFLSYFLSRTSLGLYGIWIGVTIGAVMRGGFIYLFYVIAARSHPKEDVIATS